MADFAKVVVKGTPISKSNFKLWNRNGRAILPNNSGKYHDRYANYEDEIALMARMQNPDTVFKESLIAILRVYYKREKRHPDTNNITKSIFDGIEKSGLIVNDAQIRRLIIEEYYDKTDPRFELELYKESIFKMRYEVYRNEEILEPRLYDFPSNKKVFSSNDSMSRDEIMDKAFGDDKKKVKKSENAEKQNKLQNTMEEVSVSNIISETTTAKVQVKRCSICNKEIKDNNYKKADGGKTLICSSCFKKMF